MTTSPMATTDSRHLPLSSHHFPVNVEAQDFDDVDDGGGGGETVAGGNSSSSQDIITRESVGSLVCVNGKHIGILRFFGKTHFQSGQWCGVEFSEAVGKNDGKVQGVRYFSCENEFGMFAPLSMVTKVNNAPSSLSNTSAAINSGIASSGHNVPVDINNRPKGLPIPSTECSNNILPTNTNYQPDPPLGEETPVAPATTPVTDDMSHLASSLSPSFGIKRMKKDTKRAKDGYYRVNPQQKKKRRLDNGDKCLASTSAASSSDKNESDNCTPTQDTLVTPNIDLPNLLTVKLKEKILGSGFSDSPLYSPPPTYNEWRVSRMERLRSKKDGICNGTPKTSRIGEAKFSSPAVGDSQANVESTAVDYTSKEWIQSTFRPMGIPLAATFDLEQNPLPEEGIFDTVPQSFSARLEPVRSDKRSEDDEQGDDGTLVSPVTSTARDDTVAESILNLESFPAKRPSSISLAFQGFSSEDSSEQGIFGVSTPELIGGDSASLALSIPTSCCSSPDALGENDNESSLGLLTPSHLQDWNSNANEEDIYQHLRSPSVDDLEEFEEEDKTVDQDLSNQCGVAPVAPLTTFSKRMVSSLHGTLVLNENDGLTTIHHHHNHPMHQSLHEALLQNHSQGRVRRDRTYTQLPTVPNLNRQHDESQLQNRQQQQQQQQKQANQPQHQQHAPLSFRGSGSGSGSGYCASDPFTDSDFNTESEADHDHDECSSSAPVASANSAGTGCSSTHINSTSLKNRSARVIDGALYTSHHHQHGISADRASPSQLHQSNHNQHQLFNHNRQDNNASSTTTSVTDSAVSVGKSMDMISSSISVSVSSNSASACASEMESSGFYSDASERNPSGGSVMSESDHVYGHNNQHGHGHRRSSRHLSKSSSDCDDSSVALSMGMKMVPLKPLTQSEDDDSVQILSASSMCNDDDDEAEEGIDEMSSLELANSLNETLVNGNQTKDSEEHEKSHSKSVLEHDVSPKRVAIVKTKPPTVEYQSNPLRSSINRSLVDQQVPHTDEEEDNMMMYEEEDMDVDLFADYNTSNEYMEKMNESYGALGQMERARGRETSFISNVSTSQCESDMVDMELEMELSKSLHDSDVALLSSPNTTAANGNLFDGACDSLTGGGMVGGGTGFPCFRSQSVNCIASLTSSTSSASTVTTKSCVTAGGGGLVPKSMKGKNGGKSGSSTSSSSNGKTQQSTTETKSKQSKAGTQASKTTAASKEASVAGSGSGNVTSTTTDSTGNKAASGSRNTAAAPGNSSSNVPAEQSSVVSTTTTGGCSTTATTNRRSIRMSATSGKSAAVGAARKGASVAGGGTSFGSSNTSKANISNLSTISSSTELNKTSRSTASTTAKGNGHGSTRSLASVGLGSPSASSVVSNKSVAPAAKKLNKWDAVMTKIAENQHKTINVKDVKSKVFNSSAIQKLGSGPGSVSGGASGSASAASSNCGGGGGSGKMVKGAKSASRVTLADRCNENDPLVPPAVHRRQHHFSSRSSTVSDSSVDDHQAHRGPPPAKHHRVKKDTSINRRQVSDLSSASDYSATTQSQLASAGSSNPKSNASSHQKSMTTGTRRAQRGGAATASGNNTTGNSAATSGPHGTKSSAATASGNANSNGAAANKSLGTRGAQTSDLAAKKKGPISTQTSLTKGVAAKSKVGSSTVSSHQNDNPSTKSHPAVKPLRDRNRLGPVGKNYGSTALDANANESEAPLLRGQSSGELDPSGKTCTKVPGAAEPLIADPSANNNTSNHLIINKNKTSAHNNRVSSHNQHNTQNSVLVQENTTLKEEVSQLTSVVSKLKEQISQLTASSETTQKSLAEADTKCLALSIVTQQIDGKRLGVYEQLVQQQAENNEWKHRLDEKLSELQKLQLEYEKEREHHQEGVRAVTARHELEVEVTVRNCENKLEQLQKRHDDTLAELKRSHTDELERLQETQKQELDQTIQKHRELLDQHRNQSPHDILHKEVESLQVVVEMRNEEIRVLRKDLMDYKNTLNDLQMAREHGKSLVAKIEDLEAQLEKARADKRSLQEKYQMLETNVQQIESEKNRLVRCNEELSWKMKSYEIVEN